MNELFSSLIPEALAWTLLHSLWQGLAVAGLLWLALTLLGRRTNARYWTAVGAMALLLVLPALTFRSQLANLTPAAPELTAVQSAAAASAQPRVNPAPAGAPAGDRALPPAAAAEQQSGLSGFMKQAAPALVLLWLAGALILVLRLFGGLVVIRRLRRRGLSLPNEELTSLFTGLQQRLALGKRVALRLSERVAVPLVIGVFRPLILLPVTLASGLTSRDLELLLAHELAHVRRNDLLVNTLQRAAETVMYYHPATWWISSIILEERESACDELAAAVTGSGHREYASALLRLGEQQQLPVFAASAAGGTLVRRVERLLGRDRPAQRLLPLALAALLIVSAGLLLPGNAQAEPDDGGYRSVWATVHPRVQFDPELQAIERMPAGSFALLEERQGGQLVRRALLAAPGTTAAQAAALAGGEFTASVDRPESTIWFEAGPETEPVDLSWVAEVLERNVLHALRQDWEYSPTIRVVRTSSPELFESFVFAEYRQRAALPVATDGADLQFRFGLQVRQHTHLLAHGLVDAESVLVSVFEALRRDDVSVGLAQDTLLLIPWLPSDEHKLELLEVLAIQLRSLPAVLTGEFEAAVASFGSPDWEERARLVFEPDYRGALGGTFVPLNFAFGTLNSSAATEPAWYAELSPAGYVARPQLDFMIRDPAQATLYNSATERATGASHELFGTAAELPAGAYSLLVGYHGRIYETHIEVDTDQLLPLVRDVELTAEGRLSWSPVAGAERYRVDVRTHSGVGQTRWLSGTELDLRSEFPGPVAAGFAEVVNIWAVAGPEQCRVCAIQASVTAVNLPVTVPD